MQIIKNLPQQTLPIHHAAHIPGTPILKANNLGVQYNHFTALAGVTFELNVGEQVAVVGPNGAGKSTLFKVIAGVLQPSSGYVKIAGQGPRGHICIAYVPQRSLVDWRFPVSVADVVMMGRIGKLGFFRWPKSRDWQLVHQSLELVGLDNLSNRQISELSGGQQQRMFIARALAQEAELMLLDEPFTGLDIVSQREILKILETLQQRGVTVLASTHDLQIAQESFDRILLLNHQMIGFGVPGEVLSAERLLEAYGGHLHLVNEAGATIALGDTCCDGDGIDEHLA